MSDVIQIFKSEFNTLTSFQKELHMLTAEEAEKGAAVATEYTSEFHEKVAWRSQITRDLKSRTDGNKVVYQVNNVPPFDLLEWIVMCLSVPRIEIRDKFKNEYQVCWKRNLCHEIISEATVCFDDDVKQTLKLMPLIAYRNYLLHEKLDRGIYLESIGNIPILTEWANVLPMKQLDWFQPWFFDENANKSIPLYLCRKSTITFEYKYNLDISKHILMRRFIGDKWTDIPFDRKIIEKVSNEYKIKYPTLKGFYVQISDEERQLRKEHPDGNKYNYYDFILIEGRNNIKLSYSDTLDLRSIYPTKAIIIIPVNKSMNTQCFTYKNNAIIGKVKIMYQKDKEKIEECSYDFIKNILSRRFPRAPYEEGLGGIPLTNKFISINSDVAIAFASEMDAQLIVDYKDTDPYLNIDVENDNDAENNEQESEEEIEVQAKVAKQVRTDRFQVNYLYIVSKKLEFVDGICKKEDMSGTK